MTETKAAENFVSPTNGVRRGGGVAQREQSHIWVPIMLTACVPTPHDSIVSVFVVLAALTVPAWWKANWRNVRFRRLTLASLVWFAAQFVSDLVHGSTPQGAVLGSWQPIVALLAIGFMAWCFHESSSTLSVVAVAMIAQPGFFYLSKINAVSDNPWKYVWAIPVSLVGAALLERTWPERRVLISLFFLAAAILNFAVDFRSLAGQFFIAAVIMIASGASRAARLRALAGGLLATILAVPLLIFVINHGYASEDYKRQHAAIVATSDPKAYLMNGRPEFLVSTSVIQHHPWLGIGSHRQLSMDDIENILIRASDEGIGLSPAEQYRLFGQGANTHSLLPNAWVSAGILAAPFWLYALYLVASAVAVGRRISALLCLGAPMLLWDSFFSPWSGHYEMVLGVLVGLALYVHQQSDEDVAGAFER